MTVFVWLDCLSNVIVKKRSLFVQFIDLTPVILDQLVADDVLAANEKNTTEALPEKLNATVVSWNKFVRSTPIKNLQMPR